MNSTEEKTPPAADALPGPVTADSGDVAAVEEAPEQTPEAASPEPATDEVGEPATGPVPAAAEEEPEEGETVATAEQGEDEPIPPSSERAMQALSHVLNAGGTAGMGGAEGAPQPAFPPGCLEEQAEKLEQLAVLARLTDAKTGEVAAELAQVSQSLREMAGETAKAAADLSLSLQKVADDTGQTAEQLRTARVTSALSPWFLVLSLLALVLLLAGMGYLAMQQKRLQQRQDKVSFIATEAAELQEKKLAAFDRHFAELLGAEIKGVREAAGRESVKSKLNRLRAGAAEQKLVRKSSGDWLLPGVKKEELVTDQETIEALNQAFERSGRQLAAPPGMPPHSVLVLLKPDGKGGTELVATRETVPVAQPEKTEPDRKTKKR